MTLDPKALEAAAEAIAKTIASRHEHTARTWMSDHRVEEARAAITAYLAATKATAHDPAPPSEQERK
jgi:hypothetical protein